MLSRISRQICSFGIVCFALLALGNATFVRADELVSRVLLKEGFSSQHVQKLTAKLRIISGWTNLEFSADGRLRLGTLRFVGGSQGARELLRRAVTGRDLILVEDASGRTDVVFCNVVKATRWPANSEKMLTHILRIDFDDFSELLGDALARQAFDPAWGVLHELDHVVNGSPDTLTLGDAGECEANINSMRRELDLPERIEYFFTQFPLTETSFRSRFVRLAFERRTGPKSRKQRYWLLWDASVVGGLPEQRQIALVR